VSNFTDGCNIHRSYAFRIASFLAKLDSWNKVAVFKTATSLEPHWKYDCVPPLRLVDVDGHGQQKCLSPPHISSTVHLCPRACDSRIPFLIFQTWKSLLLAPSVLHVVRSWTRTNPEFEYFLFDDASADEYVERWLSFDDENFVEDARKFSAFRFSWQSQYASRLYPNRSFGSGAYFLGCIKPPNQFEMKKPLYSSLISSFSPEERAKVRTAYKKLTLPASRADVWRLLVLYEFGGFYFDIDSAARNAFRTWVNPQASMVTGVGVLKDAHQWGLIYQARHPFLAVAIRFVTENVLTTDISVVNSNVIGYTGPSVLDQAIKFVVCMNPRIQSSMQVLAGNYMNWNIQSKVPGVPEEMIREGSVHY